MADELFDTRKLLVLRKLTRAVADLLRGQLLEHLSALAPLLRPKVVLGEFVGPAGKDNVPNADKTFKEIQTQYAALAATRLYSLPPELNSPLSVLNMALELTPLEYVHAATSGAETKSITITPPLQWAVSFGGFGPKKIRELLANRNRVTEDLHQCVLHALMIGAVFSRQPGITRIFEGLHFPVQTIRRPEFGDLPLTCIVTSVSTVRPPDDVLMESTELSGMNVFEEVVKLEDIMSLRDVLRERLLDLVKTQAPTLLPTTPTTPAAS